MLDVCIAMIPTAVYGVVQFGIHSLFVILVTVLAAVLSEYLWQRGMKKEVTITDCSAVVTGLILALNMPPEIPLWIPALGAVFAIIIAKQMFGGLGQNFMNPALAGRCFLLISLAKYMNNFTSKPINFDATTGATPLAVMKTALKAGTPATADVNLFQLFVGHIPGTIGEVSAIALLLGAAYLLWRKVISFEIPVIYIVTTAIFVFIFGEHSLNYVLAQVLGGADQGGDGVVELVRDPGAELAEHGEAGALDQFRAGAAQVLQGGGEGLLLLLEVLGQHRVLQVEVLGAHEAAREGADRQGRQGGADGRVPRQDDLQLLGGEAHEHGLGGGDAREEGALPARQGHEADEGARGGQVRQDLAPGRVPVQADLPVEDQVDGADGFALGDQLGALGDDEAGAGAQDPFDAGQQFEDDGVLAPAQAL